MSIEKLRNAIINSGTVNEQEFNPQREIKEYRDYLESLYKTVELSISDLKNDGFITLEKNEVRIVEDDLGEYGASALNINFGKEKITFIPEGTMFIGSKGRVVVIGPRKKSVILLVQSNALGFKDVIFSKKDDNEIKKINWKWVLVNLKNIKNKSGRDFIELNNDTILDLLVETING